MVVPKASDSGALAAWISSVKIESCTGLQPVPPHSTGQCGTDQPFLCEDAGPVDDVVPARVAARGELVAD